MEGRTLQQLTDTEALGHEATRERTQRLETRTQDLERRLADLEAVMMETLDRMETRTDLSSLTTSTVTASLVPSYCKRL